MKKYSFVLPAYKARFFREAIDSILAQTYKDFELIIVNDASPEDLDSIVNSYDDSRIRYYVNEQNIGGKDLVAQWNHCLEYAKGEYIILASDDDVYFSQYLEKMDALVQKYPEVNVFRPRIQVIDATGRVCRVYGVVNELIGALEFVYNLHSDIIGSAIGYYIFKKDELVSIGGFVNYPKAWASDDATVMLMARNGLAFCPEVLFSFRNSSQQVTNTFDYETVKGKLHAAKCYHEFIKEYLGNSVVENEYDRTYYHQIDNNLNNLLESGTRWTIDNASFITQIRLLREILSLECATPIFILKRIVNKILRTFHIIER